MTTSAFFESARRTVLMIDMVESVRLIENDQKGVVTLWLQLTEHVETALLPKVKGRLVKSTGDGMLLDLETVPAALQVAFGIRDWVLAQQEGVAPDAQMHVRMGMEIGDLLVKANDVYGHNVNIASRLADLADPGQIMCSAAVRDLITHGVDAEVVDMGECFLKHVSKPVRAYRIAPVGAGTRREILPVTQPLLPTLAVIPFRSFGSGEGAGAIGQILAEELIRAFGESPHLNVISRLSTAPFAAGDRPLGDIADALGASHVMTGTAVADGDKLRLSLDLTEVRSGHVIWSDRFSEKIGHVLIGDQQMVSRVSQAVGKAVLDRELARARSLPVRTLESYTLMLAAINASYRLSLADFTHAWKMLEAVIDRNPRHSVPLAWMGNWHVLKVQQGWTDDPEKEKRLAESRTARALDLNPDCAQALTIDGLVQTNLSRRFDHAENRYAQALTVNPSNALANLLKGALHAFKDEGTQAVELSRRALSQSPFDPQRYFFDCLTAVSLISAGKPEEALVHAEQSLRANSTHTSTLRTLAIAQWQVGREEESRETVRKLTVLEPSLTVSKWQASNPAADYEMGKTIARILAAAGVPE